MSSSSPTSRHTRGSNRRWARLTLEPLEDRLMPSGVPPLTITPPTTAPLAVLNNLGDAQGNAAITANELDFYRLIAPCTANYTFSARTPSSSLDTVLGVFDSEGALLTYNDDISDTNKDSALTIQLTGGQQYFFGVTNFSSASSGAYTWKVDGPADDSLENNDTRSIARNLGTLTATRIIPSLRMADGADWFRFTMTAAGTDVSLARIDFTHAQGDLDLALFNSIGTQLASSASTTDREEVSLAGLAAGTYYVRVAGFQRAYNPGYTLTIRPGTPDDSSEDNDSLGQATDFGLLTATTNTLSNRRMADSQDWYRFAMNGPGSDVNSVSINFTHARGDLDFKLYDSAGTELAVSDGTTDSEVISLAGRPAGTYYMQVYGYQGAINPNYSLTIMPGGSDDVYEENDSRLTAKNLGTLTTLRTIGNLVMADAADWFRFSMAGAGGAGSFARLEFQHTQGDLDLLLYNAAGTQLDISQGESDAEQVSLDGLPAGTYYLQAYGFQGATNPSYSLVINPGIVDDAFENNDTQASARNLGTLTANKTLNNLVMADADDWFNFTTLSAGSSGNFVRINFTHTKGDLDLELYDAGGTRLASSTSTADFEQISLDGRAAGTYSVRVFGYSGATNPNYSLIVNTSVGDDVFEDNDSQGQAASLGNVSANRTVTGLVMADADDWFSFTTTRAGTSGNYVRLNFIHARGDLDLELYGAGGTPLLISNGSVDNEQVSLNGLAAGTYYIHAFGASGAINPSYSLSFNVAAGDWFTSNITDVDLRSLGQNRFTDGSLSRNDMLDLFSQVELDNTVTANELADLRRIVSGASTLNLSDAVRNLTNKIVNVDPANSKYQGAALGNLQAGSPGSVLDKLVDKWFLGLDHPLAKTEGGATFTYQSANGSLFVNGPTYQDIVQGMVGDCYFLAGLAETAFRTPSALQQMFTDNGDNTYTVRFFNNGVADYVTVDRFLPVDINGNFVFANIGSAASNANNELWVALAEKAYVQINESAWLRGQTPGREPRPRAPWEGNGENAYQSVSNGWTGEAIQQITGRTASLWHNFTSATLLDAFNAGKLIAFSSKGESDKFIDANQVVKNHAYALVGYDAGTQRFTLFNPWGINNTGAPGLVQLTFSQVVESFESWDLNSNSSHSG